MMTRSFGTLTVVQVPCLTDNYGFVLRDEATGKVAVVDTPDADVLGDVLDQKGWSLDMVLNTHWHPDHTGGNEALAARFGAIVVGPKGEADRIPGLTRPVGDGDHVELGSLEARVIGTPGHTLGHIIFVFDALGVGFVGDTLFRLGCGRLFEGTAEQMWASLSAIRALPPDTTLYCAHEYSAANAAFAQSLEPNNPALAATSADISSARANDLPTVPLRLKEEVEVNPFLRADDPSLAATVGLAGHSAPEVFAEIRRRKDVFA